MGDGVQHFFVHLSKLLSAYGPFFKLLSIFGHIFSSVCSRAVKMRFRVHSKSLDIGHMSTLGRKK